MSVQEKSEARRLLEAQKASFLAAPYVSSSVRKDRLERLLDVLLRHETDICNALMSDYGYRSADQSWFAEVVTSVKPIKVARRNLKKWMKPERRPTGFPFNVMGGRSSIEYQPLGVVGIISPWNFPVNLTLSPLADVLAAGNRALIKPSEITPATSEVMARMMASVFDPTEVAVVTGGAEVGKDFSALPFDHLVYTGGETVARHVMKAAAENLVPVTLELGGKSPVIIGETAKLKLAAKRILFGKTFNVGQICLAPDYVYVPEHLLKDFVSEMQVAAKECFPDQTGSADYVSVVNGRHAQRIKDYLTEVNEYGGELVELGPSTSTSKKLGNMVPITLAINPSPNAKVSQEEVFGPILSVYSYQHIDEVISHINHRPKPLALYYFGYSSAEKKRILQETSSGGVTVNDVIMHYTFDSLPFGGVGASGMGAYHGFDGFKQFSNARAVYQQSRFDIGRLLRPPYGRTFRTMGKLLMKLS